MDYPSYFKDKKITVMGLGLLGRGVGDVAFLAEQGAKVLVTDLKSEEELKLSLEELKDFDIEFVLGEHRLEDFRGADMVLKAASVPLDSPYIKEAEANNVPVEMSASLFARLSGAPVIGVTGTRGKSTVVAMVHHVLKETTEGGSVLLGGNVRGVSNLQLLNDVEEESIAVMELDSWQLQGFGSSKISPQIAIFTSFMDDHLDYYPDRESYFDDKAQIFLHQEAGDVLVTTREVFLMIQEYAGKKGITLAQDVVLVDASEVPDEWQLTMPGEHNRINAALALAALRATSLTDEDIRPFMELFPGVPGRLQFLGEHGGVKIYNDNNATTPEATIAALRALGSEKNVVLITGGSDKGLELAELPKVIEETCKHVVLYSGTGTEKLKSQLSDAVPQEEHELLKGCVDAARGAAEKGDIILFSPAFASFGKYFKNEYDRNDQFVGIIESLWTK